MVIIAVEGPLECKTSTSCYGLETRAVFWLPLLICVGVSPACGCVSLFTCGFGVSSFSFLVNYNLLFFDREPDIWRVTVYTFYLWFYSRVNNNSIPPCGHLLHSRVTSNFILHCNQQLRVCCIFFLAAADNIFVSELSIRLSSVLINMLDNGTSTFCKFSPRQTPILTNVFAV